MSEDKRAEIIGKINMTRARLRERGDSENLDAGQSVAGYLDKLEQLRLGAPPEPGRRIDGTLIDGGVDMGRPKKAAVINQDFEAAVKLMDEGVAKEAAPATDEGAAAKQSADVQALPRIIDEVFGAPGSRKRKLYAGAAQNGWLVVNRAFGEITIKLDADMMAADFGMGGTADAGI